MLTHELTLNFNLLGNGPVTYQAYTAKALINWDRLHYILMYKEINMEPKEKL